MTITPMLKSKVSVLALVLLFASPLFAQQKRPVTPRKPAAATPVAEPVLTFDTLLADDNYRVYSEVRNVGTLVRSEGFNNLLGPAIELVAPPKQFSTIVKWIKAHAELLAGSRMLAASWPSKKNLPPVLLAIEFASADEAKKFALEVRQFLPKLDPKPAASPSSGAQPAATTSRHNNPATEASGMFAQLQIKQTGALVLVTDKPISLGDLKPRGSRLLAEDPNFALARNRFASDAIFVYVDFKAIQKEEDEQRRKWEEAEKRRQLEAAANPTPEPSPDPDSDITTSPESDFQAPPTPESLDSTRPPVPASDSELAIIAAESERAASIESVMVPLSMALFGGRSKWPEAVGAALAFEDDSYAVRALIVNSPENRSLPIPFLPQLASGPALTPTSPNVLPAEVDFFVTLSLDYSQIYDGMLRAFTEGPIFSPSPVSVEKQSSPFEALEEKVGIKVKEGLLPLLGNEIAVVLPKAPATTATAPAREANDNPDRRIVRAPEITPVIAVAIRDKEAVKGLIPKIIESLGFKGASLMAQTEKRGDTEVISYANLFSYAFIGDFLLLSPDAAATRRAVDSYLSGQTLSSDTRFRNATRWQSRQVQGQVYVTPDMVDSYVFAGRVKTQKVSSQPPQVIEPLTYALSNEGLGPIHEVRVPRSLLNMLIVGLLSKADESPIFTNESIAKNMLRTVASAQATYKETKGNGNYGSLDELVAAGLLTMDMVGKYGYKIELGVVSNKFEVTAIPIEYGKSGRRSFFIDESGVLRGGDHAGGAATISDQPINE